MSVFHITDPLPRLTKRQIECLRFIATYLMQHNDYPSQKEIAIAMGLRSNTAYTFTEPLQKKGYLNKTYEVGRRNLRLTNLADKILNSHYKDNHHAN
jgi:Mn-dependent DtxR family transcriptional regulator